MNKRRIFAVLIAFVLTIGATAMWSASTIQREGDPDAIVLEDSGTEAGVDQPKKKGNKVVKVLAAPFKMFGRLLAGTIPTKFIACRKKMPSDLRVPASPALKTRTTNRSSATLPSLRRKSIWKPVVSTC